LLQSVGTEESASAPLAEEAKGTVFVAETTGDLREQREAIRRDLQQRGYTVLPDRTLPLVASELEAAVREDLSLCKMSIHPVGRNYGLVPEEGTSSVVEIQNELAIERAGQEAGFARLLWIPPGLEIKDERQRKVVENLRMDPRMQSGADLLETSLEDFRVVYQERLARAAKPAPGPVAPAQEAVGLVYLIYDQRDVEQMGEWSEYLFHQGFEVVRPVFEGDEAEVREYHEENLRSCDGALILYGRAGECWLRRKLRELQKSAGYGRSKPAPVVAIAVIPPKSAEKESFRTHEAMVIPQMDGFSPDALGPFISRLKGR
jgi:hypothetical protein